MAARVYRNPNTTDSDNYGLYSMHYWAVHFSQDPGWNIIDSYNSNASPQRLKGDPISGDLWGGAAYNQAGSNSWFVVEQANPELGFAPMQWKVQAAGNTLYYDPSGIDYGYDGVNRVCCTRFAPWGGWNLADSNPDFANPEKVTKDLASEWGITPQSGRHFFIIDDDYILLLNYSRSERNLKSVPFYVGRYEPFFPGNHTPEHPCFWYYGHDQDYHITQGYWTSIQNFFFFNENEYSTNTKQFIVTCPDENGEIKRWIAQAPPTGQFILGMSRRNEFDLAQPTFDFIQLPVYGKRRLGDPLSPDYRVVGHHKHVWLGLGIGIGAMLQNQAYKTNGVNQPCVVHEWDGSSGFVL